MQWKGVFVGNKGGKRNEELTPTMLQRKVHNGVSDDKLVELFLECGALKNQRIWGIALNALKVGRKKTYDRLVREHRKLL